MTHRHTAPDGTIHLIALRPVPAGWHCWVIRPAHRTQRGRGGSGTGRTVEAAVAGAAAQMRGQ